MKLQNGMELYVLSEGQLFQVTHICNSAEGANAAMQEHPETACISEDDHGRIYLALKEPLDNRDLLW